MAKTSDAVVVVGVGIIGYLLYSMLGKGLAGAGKATDALAQQIADWWVKITSNPPMVPQGSVYFPDGSYALVANIPGGIAFDANTNTGRFVYLNQTWAIPAGSRDNQGNWPAVPAATYAASPQAFLGNAAAQPPPDFGLTNASDWQL